MSSTQTHESDGLPLSPSEQVGLVRNAYCINAAANQIPYEGVMVQDILMEICSPQEHERVNELLSPTSLEMSETDRQLLEDLIYRVEIVTRSDIREWAKTWKIELWLLGSLPAELVNFFMLLTSSTNEQEQYFSDGGREIFTARDVRGHMRIAMQKALELNTRVPKAMRFQGQYRGDEEEITRRVMKDMDNDNPLLILDYPDTGNMYVNILQQVVNIRGILTERERAQYCRRNDGTLAEEEGTRSTEGFYALLGRLYTIIDTPANASDVRNMCNVLLHEVLIASKIFFNAERDALERNGGFRI